MATKDWKKVGRNQWNKLPYNLAIEPSNKKFILYVINYKTYNDKLIKTFKTKSQALAYARAYMRKH